MDESIAGVFLVGSRTSPKGRTDPDCARALVRRKTGSVGPPGICFLEWTDSISDPADGQIDPVALLICRRTLLRKVLVEGQPQ